MFYMANLIWINPDCTQRVWYSCPRLFWEPHLFWSWPYRPLYNQNQLVIPTGLGANLVLVAFPWRLKGLQSKVIGVRDLLGVWTKSESHSSSSDTLTRLIFTHTIPGSGLVIPTSLAANLLVVMVFPWRFRELQSKVIGVRDLLGCLRQ